MFDQGGMAWIVKASSDRINQAQALVDLAEKKGTAVGRETTPIEIGLNLLFTHP
jgi:hypothetical protein